MIENVDSLMPSPEETPEAIALRYNLSVEALAALLDETDRVRGMCSPADVSLGLEQVIDQFGQAMSAAPSTFSDPGERAVATRTIEVGIEIYVKTMEAAQRASN